MAGQTHSSWKKRRKKAIWSNPTFRSRPVDRQRVLAVNASAHARQKLLQEQLRNGRPLQ